MARHDGRKHSEGEMKKPCARILNDGKVCGHAFDEHAADRNFPDQLRCFHGAVTGDGCADKFDDRCSDYLDPDGVKNV